MNSRFTANLVFLLSVNLMVKPFYLFVIDRGVQNASGETYGLYAALLSTSLLFYILLDLGLTHYNNREVARDKSSITDRFTQLLGLKIVFIALYAAVVMFLGYMLNYGQVELKWLLWLCLNQVLLSMMLFLRSFVSGLQLFKRDAILSIADKILLILIAGGLLFFHAGTGFPIEQFIYAQTISYSLALLLSFALLSPYLKTVKWRMPEIRSMWKLIKSSLPYASVILMMTLYYRLDTIMLERMLPADELSETASYVAAFRQMDAAQNIAILFTVILLPLYAKLLNEGGAFMEVAAKSFSMIGVFAIALIIPCLFVPDQIMGFLYPGLSAGYGGNLLAILMCSFLPMCCIFIYGTLLTADARLKLLNQIVIFGVLANFVLNYIFIPDFKAEAAAYTSLGTQCLIAILKLWFVYKLFGPLMSRKQAFQGLLFICLCLPLNVMLYQIPFSWIWFTISSVALTFVISILTGLLKLQSIRFILRKE